MARTTDWGRTLAIVNPTAHAGAAAAIAERLRRFLALYLRDTNSFEIARTEQPNMPPSLRATLKALTPCSPSVATVSCTRL